MRLLVGHVPHSILQLKVKPLYFGVFCPGDKHVIIDRQVLILIMKSDNNDRLKLYKNDQENYT